jgi:hypothetical protein
MTLGSRSCTPQRRAAPWAVRALIVAGYASSTCDGVRRLVSRWFGDPIADDAPHYDLRVFTLVYFADIIINFTLGSTLDRWSAMDVVAHHVPALAVVPMILCSAPSAATRVMHIAFSTANINEVMGMLQSFRGAGFDTAARGASRSKLEVLRRCIAIVWWHTFGFALFAAGGETMANEMLAPDAAWTSAVYAATVPLTAWMSWNYAVWSASNVKWLCDTKRYPRKLYWLIAQLAVVGGIARRATRA